MNVAIISARKSAADLPVMEGVSGIFRSEDMTAEAFAWEVTGPPFRGLGLGVFFGMRFERRFGTRERGGAAASAARKDLLDPAQTSRTSPHSVVNIEAGGLRSQQDSMRQREFTARNATVFRSLDVTPR